MHPVACSYGKAGEVDQGRRKNQPAPFAKLCTNKEVEHVLAPGAHGDAVMSQTRAWYTDLSVSTDTCAAVLEELY